ncbi:hypothetical protein [Nevskia ramosa]|uniref:hypothetical protein n=1 Tax=Nevskia ramosa TaxID=64002 RepID=UPI0003B68A20|nr:hypothetical protein [Nevskia ramosa]
MLSIKTSGLDKLQRELKDAQAAMSSLDGTIATLKFDPEDPASVQAAIRQMESAIDSKVGRFRQNPIVGPLIVATKKQFRDRILGMRKS